MYIHMRTGGTFLFSTLPVLNGLTTGMNMSKLVIVESPAKAKTIGKMLGKDYIIKASYGHIRDLPERVFGVDIEHGFTPLYEESKTRGKNITDLKQTAKKVDEIYLAPSRSGSGARYISSTFLAVCFRSVIFFPRVFDSS